jgi:hypothetical protein
VVPAPEAESAFDHPEEFVLARMGVPVNAVTGSHEPFKYPHCTAGFLGRRVNDLLLAERIDDPLATGQGNNRVELVHR